MNLSLKWLREFVQIDETPEQLADLLTFAGVEVEDIRTRGVDVAHVVVAQIIESKQHPNADRLSVCQVDDGSGAPPRQIVCGAKNYRVGDKVPLALPGAVLPGDFKIKEGKLRGEKSEGMLCSGKELGLSDDQSGLLILSADARLGAPIGELFPPETVLEIEVTPNRPDLLSHLGVAREIGAITGRPLRHPSAAQPTVQSDTGVTVSVDEDARQACPFYTATRIDGVKVGPSPAWLRDRLESIGLRPINNIVDIANYVMLELGQPLHAFDRARLGGGGVRVRLAHAGETLRALDGRDYALLPHHCVIADTEGTGAGIGGMMGGEFSGVSEATTSIVLEAAWFLPSLIRRTSRETSLSSDASYRFERGVDVGGVIPAAERALSLILEIAGGTPRPMATVGDAAALCVPRLIPLRHAHVEAMVGVPIDPQRSYTILSSLGLNKTEGGWTAPSYRRDLEREIDLIEEITRVIGLDSVPGRAQGRTAPSSAADRAYDFQMALRRTLTGLGFAEARSLSLVPASEVAQETDAAFLKNPLSADQVALRPNLLPALLTCASRNARVGRSELRLFELGRVFNKTVPPGQAEPMRLAVLLTGHAMLPAWRGGEARTLDLHDLQAVIERLLPPGRSVQFERVERSGFALAIEVKVDGRSLGFGGLLESARAQELDLRHAVCVAELELTVISGMASGDHLFVPLPRFPAVTRDIAMLVDKAVTHAALAGAMKSASEPLLVGTAPFDVFTDPTGVKVPAEKKSVAYSLTYRAADRTLTAEEVNAAHARVKKALGDVAAVQFRE